MKNFFQTNFHFHETLFIIMITESVIRPKGFENIRKSAKTDKIILSKNLQTMQSNILGEVGL